MANIPVERETRGGGWWKWIIGLLAVALLAWIVWGIAVPEEEDELAVGEGGYGVGQEPAADTTAMAGGIITDAATIFQAEDRSELVGRQIRLSDMHVRAVPGDSVFYVTPREDGTAEPGNRVIIAALDEIIPEPPQNVEGEWDVEEGQTLTVFGTIKRVQQEQPSAWGITPQEGEDMLQEDQIYVRAQRLEITDRAQSQPQEAEM